MPRRDRPRSATAEILRPGGPAREGREGSLVKPLLVDPSGRGGIIHYTDCVARALCAADARPVLLASRSVTTGDGAFRTRRWLPKQRWGRPQRISRWPGFYAGRAAAWIASTAAVRVAIRLERPDVVHFQAPINRRFDAALLRHVRRHAAVVWTAHDILPPEAAPADRDRFASIYRAADLVVVHGETAAEAVRGLAGVEPTIVEHVPADIVRVDRSVARRRLGLPEDERILGAIGFVRAYKGYELLADTWARLGSSAPLMLVVGEVVGEAAKDVVQRLEHTDRAIVVAGYASDEDFRLAASAVDALLLPHIAASESGLLHLARSIGVPVLASDAPQLAASVQATRSGVVLPREVDAWAEAVTGPLPSAPSPPPPPEAVGQAHLQVYREALGRACESRRLRSGARGLA
jgi:glycosyltransferase involved in cell wall biosynthesis